MCADSVPTSGSSTAVRLDCRCTPWEFLQRWPRHRPVVSLWSGSGASRWSRWTTFGICDEVVSGDDPALLERLHPSRSPRLGAKDFHDLDSPPFRSGWIVQLDYELGQRFEPRARAVTSGASARSEDQALCIHLHHCPAALVHDNLDNRWWLTGDLDLGRAVMADLETHDEPDHDHLTGRAYAIGPLRSRTGRELFERAVARAIDYIHAGDVFQVNLSHVLSGEFEGSSRRFFADLAAAAGPWYGAYIEQPADLGTPGEHRAIASISPELFLELRADRREVLTRPIKGTRPAATDSGDLRASVKDQAELAMIVDLMRNDLGRICEFGSVHVPEPRSIERHAAEALLHGVATVHGRLREGLGIVELLRAAFPGGSITGAPKIRAMQIIDELEAVWGGGGRGVYTGSIGFVDDSGDAAFNIAIRTAVIRDASAHGLSPVMPGPPGEFTRAELEYAVGAGIVADSSPRAEWEETLAKAGTILALQRDHQAASSTPVIRPPFPAAPLTHAQRP